MSVFDGEYPTQQTIENLKRYAADKVRVSPYKVAVGPDHHKADRENHRSGQMLDFSKVEIMPSEPYLLTYETIPTKAASSFAVAERIGLASLSL